MPEDATPKNEWESDPATYLAKLISDHTEFAKRYEEIEGEWRSVEDEVPDKKVDLYTKIAQLVVDARNYATKLHPKFDTEPTSVVVAVAKTLMERIKGRKRTQPKALQKPKTK